MQSAHSDQLQLMGTGWLHSSFFPTIATPVRYNIHEQVLSLADISHLASLATGPWPTYIAASGSWQPCGAWEL
jgi:hypothetical protein